MHHEQVREHHTHPFVLGRSLVLLYGSLFQLVHELTGPADLGRWIVNSFLCNTLLWQHSPMSGKTVSIKRVELSILKLASVSPVAFHYLSRHCRYALALSAQMRFESNSLYHTKSHTMAKKVKHKNGLDSLPIRRRLRGCLPYTTLPTESFYMVVNMCTSLATLPRGKNNLASCQDFAEWEFPAPAVWLFWLQNSKLGSDKHLAGQVCSQLVNYVQSHWLKSTNLSVCRRLQPPFLRQLEVRFISAAGHWFCELAMFRSLKLLSSELIDKKALQIAIWNAIHAHNKFAQASFSSVCCSQRNVILFSNKCTRWQDLPISERASKKHSLATPYFGNTAACLAKRYWLNLNRWISYSKPVDFVDWKVGCTLTHSFHYLSIHNTHTFPLSPPMRCGTNPLCHTKSDCIARKVKHKKRSANSWGGEAPL